MRTFIESSDIQGRCETMYHLFRIFLDDLVPMPMLRYQSKIEKPNTPNHAGPENMQSLREGIHAPNIQGSMLTRVQRTKRKTASSHPNKTMETQSSWPAKISANIWTRVIAPSVRTVLDTDTAKPAWCSFDAKPDTVHAAISLPKDGDGIIQTRRDVQ